MSVTREGRKIVTEFLVNGAFTREEKQERRTFAIWLNQVMWQIMKLLFRVPENYSFYRNFSLDFLKINDFDIYRSCSVGVLIAIHHHQHYSCDTLNRNTRNMKRRSVIGGNFFINWRLIVANCTRNGNFMCLIINYPGSDRLRCKCHMTLILHPLN